MFDWLYDYFEPEFTTTATTETTTTTPSITTTKEKPVDKEPARTGR
jgi:hypothetical protein